ncbi:hypothetical protein V5T82_13165 [Magnetovibrio sp. PR-2]|uniref:hypothetical protein n=1 Tax=Magnetovibrio sp. PR-2 TaxID=3120356 RepID=UPI002FCE3E6F
MRTKFVNIFGLVLTSAVLSACAQYSVGGTFEGTGQQFFGEVTVMPGDIGTIKIETLDGSVACDGTSRVTSRASLMTVVGAQGMATAECTDGSSFKVDFIQTTESGGHGQGISSNGSIIKLNFNTSNAVVRSSLEMDQLDALIQ